MLMVWIIGLLALENLIFSFQFYTCGKCKENPLIIIFLGYYYRGHKLSSIAISFIDSIWQKLLYYQDVMIFCVAFSVSLRDQTRLVSNPCLLFSGEKRRWSWSGQGLDSLVEYRYQEKKGERDQFVLMAGIVIAADQPLLQLACSTTVQS